MNTGIKIRNVSVEMEQKSKVITEMTILITILTNSSIKLKYVLKYKDITNFAKLRFKIFKITTDLGISKLDFLNAKFTYKRINSINEKEILNENDYKEFIIQICANLFKITKDEIDKHIGINYREYPMQKFKIKCVFHGELYLDNNVEIENSLNKLLDEYYLFNKKINDLEEEITRNDLVNNIYIYKTYYNLKEYYQEQAKLFESITDVDYSYYFDIIKDLFKESNNVVISRLNYLKEEIKKVVKDNKYLINIDLEDDLKKENNNVNTKDLEIEIDKGNKYPYFKELEIDPINDGFDKYFKQKEKILSNLLKNCFEKKNK